MAESLQYVVARGNPVWEIDCDQKMTKFVNTLMIHFVHISLFGKDWLFIDKTASKLRNVKSEFHEHTPVRLAVPADRVCYFFLGRSVNFF